MNLKAVALIGILVGCGSGDPVKKVKDEILGNRIKPEEFKLNIYDMYGISATVNVKSQERLNSLYGKMVPADLLQVWNVTANIIDIYHAGPGKTQCGERTYQLVGNAGIVLAATPVCAEESIEILAQSEGYFEKGVEPLVVTTMSYNLIKLSKTEPAALKPMLFEWNSDFPDVPAWLKPFAPVQTPEEVMVTLADIEKARDSFRSQKLPGKTLTLGGNYLSVVAADSMDVKIVMFIDGNIRHWGNTGSSAGKSSCYLTFPASISDSYVNGITVKIESIEVAHPYREQGTWTVGKDGVEQTALNQNRSNNLVFKLENAGEGVSFSCTVPTGKGPIVYEDVLSALGAVGSIK